jgi:coenzyme PQQ precursor peptide PqqA
MEGCNASSVTAIGYILWRNIMKWQTPQASDMRYGFEITMYIATR